MTFAAPQPSAPLHRHKRSESKRDIHAESKEPDSSLAAETKEAQIAVEPLPAAELKQPTSLVSSLLEQSLPNTSSPRLIISDDEDKLPRDQSILFEEDMTSKAVLAEADAISEKAHAQHPLKSKQQSTSAMLEPEWIPPLLCCSRQPTSA